MVLTTKENLNNYVSLNPCFAAAFSSLAEMAEKPYEPGRHTIDGDDLFINALEYDTQTEEDALMEAHRTYIDVMWMVSGEEQIGVCPLKNMTQITALYDATDDSVLGRIPADCTYVQMKPGSICILFPEDGHAPGLDAKATSHVKKLIAKVRVV